MGREGTVTHRWVGMATHRLKYGLHRSTFVEQSSFYSLVTAVLESILFDTELSVLFVEVSVLQG